MKTVDRKAFAGAIAEGILAGCRAVPPLTAVEAITLHRVGRTVTKSCRGIYEEDHIGCPATQAGLIDSIALRKFVCAFDAELLKYDPTIPVGPFKVVGDDIY